MPIYEFECVKCGYQFERLQKLSDPPVSRCPKCGGKKISQLLSAPAIQFKGTGWYVTDYARKSSTGSSPSAGPNGKGQQLEGKSTESGAVSSESKSSTEKDSLKSSAD